MWDLIEGGRGAGGRRRSEFAVCCGAADSRCGLPGGAVCYCAGAVEQTSTGRARVGAAHLLRKHRAARGRPERTGHRASIAPAGARAFFVRSPVVSYRPFMRRRRRRVPRLHAACRRIGVDGRGEAGKAPAIQPPALLPSFAPQQSPTRQQCNNTLPQTPAAVEKTKQQQQPNSPRRIENRNPAAGAHVALPRSGESCCDPTSKHRPCSSSSTHPFPSQSVRRRIAPNVPSSSPQGRPSAPTAERTNERRANERE